MRNTSCQIVPNAAINSQKFLALPCCFMIFCLAFFIYSYLTKKIELKETLHYIYVLLIQPRDEEKFQLWSLKNTDITRNEEPLDESERGEEKADLKLNIQKMKIMSSGPITSWQIDGETVETVSDFIFLGSKITAVGDCSHEIKRHLLLGRTAITNLDSILKSRDYTLPTKVCLVKVMIFPVVMYGCESWTIKNAERQRINAFEIWCWRTLESPLDCKEIKLVNPKGNQS